MLSAEQLAVVYDRMYSRAEELELKAEHKQREQRRAIREQCTCVRRPEKQRAIVERPAPSVCRRRNNFAMCQHWIEMPKPNCTRGGRRRHLRRPAPHGHWRQRAWSCLAR